MNAFGEETVVAISLEAVDEVILNMFDPSVCKNTRIAYMLCEVATGAMKMPRSVRRNEGLRKLYDARELLAEPRT